MPHSSTAASDPSPEPRARAGATAQQVSPSAHADAEGRIVVAVEFAGLRQVSPTLVRELVRIAPGDAFDRAILNEAEARLLGTGRFIAAVARVEEVEEGVRIIFDLRERTMVRSIAFEGNRKFGDPRLKGLVAQRVDRPVDRTALREGQEAILALYREAGFPEATVSIDFERLEQTGKLVFTVQEGPQVRIRKILFEGNASLPDRQLKRRIETKTALWIFRTGAFDQDRAEADAGRIRNHYRNLGFLDARVTHRTILSDDGRDLTVTFTIEEGTRYRIETISFRGHTVFTEDELRSMITSRQGQTVDLPRVEDDARTLQMRYGEIGHIYAAVRPIRVFSETPGFVRITFEIDEGEAYRVGRVMVRGNQRTKDKVVRRALNLYPPDDLFDLTEAREAERRLVETRIFSSARVHPVGDRPGVRDVVIDVTEAEKVGDLVFGAGITSNAGLVGNIVLDLQNFDLFDWPRNLRELFSTRAFFGGGQRLRIELQPGTELNRFRIDFTEPYLLDQPVRFDYSAYLFERGRDRYNERRVGSQISFGKRFERGRLRDWSVELALRVENVNINDLDLFVFRDVRKVKGANLLTSLKGTLARDRTDSRFVPSTGDRVRFGYEQVGVFGGDHSFGKLTAAYSSFRTLHTDILGRKHVLELRAEGGAILGDAPVFERFFAGGTGSIRGFAFRGIGERRGLDESDGNRTNVGGDFLIVAGTEYSFPLVGENLRGHLFLDTGTAGSDGLRAALGAGVRFTIDILGPIPFELNLAAPVLRESGDETQVFSFLIGRIF